MTVTLTWEFTDDMRRIVNARVGRSGLATKEQCQACMDGLLTADWEVIQYEHQWVPK